MAVGISSNDDGVMTVFLEGDIDHHTAKEMREVIDLNVNKSTPKLLNVDFKKIQFMDSSGIGLIMGRYKLMNSIGGKLKVINVPKNLEKMVKISGLMMLNIFEDEKEKAQENPQEERNSKMYEKVNKSKDESKNENNEKNNEENKMEKILKKEMKKFKISRHNRDLIN